jgi:hypothetical protein
MIELSSSTGRDLRPVEAVLEGQFLALRFELLGELGSRPQGRLPCSPVFLLDHLESHCVKTIQGVWGTNGPSRPKTTF